jgi:SAM-dependent methyltransferase
MHAHAALDQPSAWVARFAPLIPRGKVLDLVCGSGRHSRLLAALGHQVVAIDRDADALARAAGESIDTWQCDLENDLDEMAIRPFPAHHYAGLVVTNYLHRPLFSYLLTSVAPGGILIYETFAHGNGQFGKPSNPDFLLAPGELLAVVCTDTSNSWRVIAFEDGQVDLPKPAMVQRICALKAVSHAIPVNPRLF